ncbi:MAG: NADH-quinone oxidoreductase subunit C [Nitrospirae bacterium]|uniref:NADH-quinone oxidoreductase subunit C n=1 Tax=Candidatus Magnetobacterium casense TaxID=1455061 RepID=UPI00058D3AEB|nr:NADH-quinone oxidoreductase subunit C [Candidatus Magnetobacterium casensis]MBF0338191.1 NADH-quinone oxidoreductase subunit C [Nitrospirota bacterium]
MDPAEIAAELKERFADEVVHISKFRGQVGVYLKRTRIVDIARYLHDAPQYSFDYLKDLCGVDYMDIKVPRFEVVYHLYSVRHRHMLRLNVQVSENAPDIDSVVDIWTGANWHERECYDMYGIVFNNHPDLRRILMPEDWEGHPQRKDYPTAGPEEEWRGFKEVERKAEEFKKYQWNQTKT